MAFTIATSGGNLNTLTFNYDETDPKQADIYAGLKRSDNAIDVLTPVLSPNVSIEYIDGSDWCSVTFGNIEDNTAKPLNIQCETNLNSSPRTCKIYLEYNNIKSQGYILVTLYVGTTVRVWNQNDKNTVCLHYMVLLFTDHTNQNKWYGIVLDTYMKEIPASGYIDVCGSTEVLAAGTNYKYYTSSTDIETVTLTDTLSLNAVNGNLFYYSYHITAVSTKKDNLLIFIDGVGLSNTYYVGTTLNNPAETHLYTTNTLPLSITYYKASVASYIPNYTFINTFSSQVSPSSDNFWIVLTYTNLNGGIMRCAAYKRLTSNRSNLTNVVECWSEESSENTLVLAKKIDSNTTGVSAVYEGGDGNRRLYIYRSISDISDAYELSSSSTFTYWDKDDANCPAPIITNISFADNGLSINTRQEDYGSWHSTFTQGKTKEDGNIRYYIPTFIL